MFNKFKEYFYDYLAILTLLLLIVFTFFFAELALSQTWKGGNTADYDANSVCSDVYLLHKEGTTFPDEMRDDCCPDTVLSTGWGIIETWIGDTVIIGSDTIIIDSNIVYIPVILDNSVDTLYFGSDTLVIVSIDSVFVFGGNDRTYFTTFKDAFCESLITSIDTVANDTFYCVFCDSVLKVMWWEITGTDTLNFDIWNMTYRDSRDSCHVVNAGIIQITGDYVDNTVTINNYTTNYYTDERVTYWYSDSLDSFFAVGDTININDLRTWIFGGDTYNSGGGLWVKSCDCSTGADTTITVDSLDAFMCLSTSWATWNTSGDIWATATRRDVRGSPGNPLRFQYARHTVANSMDIGTSDRAVSARLFGHDTYMTSYLDTITDLFNVGDEVFPLIDGDLDSTINIVNALYFEYDTTNNFGCFIGDTIPVHSSFGSTNAGDIMTVSHGLNRRAYRFHKTVNFSDMYSEDEIRDINEAQPDWYILAPSDDIVPYVRINGESFNLDTLNEYNTYVYSIQPTINYFEPLKVETGVYSKNQYYLGSQVIFALHYPDTIINTTCWEWQDSLIIPDCGGSSDCADSICFKFPQGYAPYNSDGLPYEYRATGDIIHCISVCELDTLDLSAAFYGDSITGEMEWIETFFSVVSSDSVDTFTIKAYNDSVVFADDDNDILKINMNTSFGANEIKFVDGSQTDTTKLYQVSDTFNIATNDSSIIVKIGSGSVFISDRAIWFSGSTIGHSNYGTALGSGVTVSGNYSTAWGDNTTASGNFSTAWGALSSTSSGTASTAFGFGTTANNECATAWGINTTASGTASTAFGFECDAKGDYSTAFGYLSKALAAYSTSIGYYTYIDTFATYSMLIGTQDTLTADSTFMSSYEYNVFTGNLALEGLPIQQTDTVLTLKADGTIGYIDIDSIASGGATLLSYAENGTFATAPSATGDNSIAMGFQALASGDYATIGGGHYNRVQDDYSTIAGGRANWIEDAAAYYGFIGGGQNNNLDDYSSFSVIGGGSGNQISSGSCFIGGGSSNDIGAIGSWCTIAGGYANTISNRTDYGFIGGGRNNSIHSASGNETDYATVCGGMDNDINADSDYSFIGGGSGNASSEKYGAILGGSGNTTSGQYAVIAGGFNNSTSGLAGFVHGNNVDIATNYQAQFFDSVNKGFFCINTNDATTPTYSLAVGGGILADSIDIRSMVIELTTVNTSTYSILKTDNILNVTYSVTGTCAITIPTALNKSGRILTIKDGGGNAGTNTITIDCQDSGDKIDGNVAGVTLTSDYDSIDLFSDGTDWLIY